MGWAKHPVPLGLSAWQHPWATSPLRFGLWARIGLVVGINPFYFPNFIYLFNYSKNSFKLPKFVETRSKLREIKTQLHLNPYEQIYTLHLSNLYLS
jgi:hypothetical protein